MGSSPRVDSLIVISGQFVVHSLALLGPYVFALLCASGALVIALHKSLVALRETSVRASSHVLRVRVIELLLLVELRLVLAHVHWLLRMSHLTVLLLVA